MLFFCLKSRAQDIALQEKDSLNIQSFYKGTQYVNKCTPWQHMRCVYITGTEVYKDGSEGKSTRHWWRMSYIGRACTAQYGVVFGKIFEAVFVVPHYIAIGVGNAVGYTAYLFRRSPEKIALRKERRKQKRLLKESKKEN